MDQTRIKTIETGRALESLLISPGWDIVQDILKSYEQGAVSDILDYKGSDMNVLRSKQMSARIVKETRNLLNQHINDAIQAARNVLMEEVKNND